MITPLSRDIKSLHLLGPLATLAALLFLVGWAYSMAFSGSWHYDDEPNLAGLSEVTDRLSALDFTLAGKAGPTGRPISLVTFAVQAEDWPASPRPFLLVNTAIHLVNIALVFLIALLLAFALHPNSRRAPWLGVFVAAAWGLSPFLASSALMVIQRMTLLSGTFVLLGLIFYLVGRLVFNSNPRLGLATIVAGILGGTLLATLSKENGSLLPVFALVIEWILLRDQLRDSHQRLYRWIQVTIIAPSLAVLAFLIQRSITQSGYELRAFTMRERLLTQPRALWDYLINLTLPRQSAVTPFTDNFTISSGWFSPSSTIVAAAAILVVVIFVWRIRRFSHIPLFGLCWFLGGHLLESTVVSLEMYFAHRNYLPAIGLFFALGYGLILSSSLRRYRFMAIGGSMIYLVLLTAILVDTTRLWGSPALAAEVWYLNDEDSVRAAQFLSRIYVGENDLAAADKVIQKTRELNPDNSWLALRSLTFCHVDESEYLQRLQDATGILEDARVVTFIDATAIHYLVVNRLETDSCQWLTGERFLLLLQAAQKDLSTRSVSYTRHRLAYAEAWYHLTMANPAQAIESYHGALKIYRHPETAVLIAHLLIQTGQDREALAFLEQALLHPPESAVSAAVWRRRIGAYLQSVNSISP